MKLSTFNLEAAMNGAKVVTRNGREAVYVDDADGLITFTISNAPCKYLINGKFLYGNSRGHEFDLFMLDESEQPSNSMKLEDVKPLIDEYFESKSKEELEEIFSNCIQRITTTPKPALSYWVKFDFFDVSTRPEQPGKYLICRKDGKIHWETWNGSGWAYNHNEVRYWAKIVHPEK